MKLKIFLGSLVVILLATTMFFVGKSMSQQEKIDSSKKATQSETSSSESSKKASSSSKSEASSSKKSSTESDKDIQTTLTASGVDYQISLLSAGIGGAGPRPIAINRILDESTALDVIASTPGFNKSHLISIDKSEDNWQIVVKKNNVKYTAVMTHYQQLRTIIKFIDESGSETRYWFKIPENIYQPFLAEEEQDKQDFLKKNQSPSASSMSQSEAEKLAMDYFNLYPHGKTGNWEPKVKSSATEDRNDTYIVLIFDTPQHFVPFDVNKSTKQVTSGNLSYAPKYQTRNQ